MLIWIQFGLCVAVIGVAGARLCRYGDVIAAHTGLSRNWIGLIMVATVTSLPELVTGLSAVTVAQAPDLAAGDALGSCVFNLAILALVDVFYRREAIYATAGIHHAMSAALGMMLLSTVGLAILLTQQGMLPSVGHLSVASVVVVAIYLLGMRGLYLTEQRRPAAVAEALPSMSLKSALMRYSVATAVIVGMGTWLPLIGVELARTMGWSKSFVGTLLMAVATSVPEMATTWGALRIGAIDMAFGGLLGSNLFDVLILALDDFAYLRGPIYADLSPLHGATALIACAMSAVVIVALVQRPIYRVWRTASWASLALLALYLFNSAVQYLH
ncbi:sodium:calcium antiporter [Ideonella sp.]|uniref:sodium:calcium antiporter n=1 Tax=Ideonella sp. TaxID=1929293 RepID=UPI0035B35E5D